MTATNEWFCSAGASARWYAPVNVVTEALPRYVEQTSQDAALAQALQAEYEAGSGVCPPQAAATAGSDSVENPNSSQAQFPPLSEPDFQPAPTRSRTRSLSRTAKGFELCSWIGAVGVAQKVP